MAHAEVTASSDTSAPEVSVVIPVYNGAGFIADSLARLECFIDEHELDTEVVAVDDGSVDGTGGILRELAGDRVTVLELATNRGKFAALKAGMAAARGRCRVFTDADLPYDLEAIPHMADLVIRGGFHIAVGDRTLAESDVFAEQTALRRLSTRVFSLSVRLLVTGELFDTQAGLKAYRGEVAEALFPLLTADGFAGDVELLYIALKYNLAIRRVPVRLLRSGPSTVSVTTHALPMLRRIAGLRWGWTSGRYESPALRDLSSQRYWNEVPGA
jgi:glycosyltransferase involved in cell wall biosynthesis